jgi:Zn ribbon nucleic-acid-binding protein
MRALFCPTCNAFREIETWHERAEALVIALEPCGHQIRRHAGLEWSTHRAAV